MITKRTVRLVDKSNGEDVLVEITTRYAGPPTTGDDLADKAFDALRTSFEGVRPIEVTDHTWCEGFTTAHRICQGIHL